jgi:tetratricopeptide (TPR) repeat protein
MDDEIRQGWSVDPQTRRLLRLEQVRKQVDRMAWSDAVLEAEELLDEVPDHVEALDLLARAQLGMMDAEGAVLTWEQLQLLDPRPAPERLAGLAMARLDTCDLVGASEAARETLRLDPGNAEAHFVLGMSLERLPGRSTEAATAFLAANRLDPLSYPFPWQLDAMGWEQALTTAMLQLPPEFRELWEGVPVRLPRYPDLDKLREAAPPMSPRILGMFLGEPPDDGDPFQTRPDGLLLFTENLARVSSLDELIERIADVLEQEALVWIGEDVWDPDDVELEEP